MQHAARLRDFREILPSLARHEGIWDGTYRYYDADGVKTDEHHSRVVCRFPTSGAYPYHQTNYYRWSDGRQEVRDFPATIVDGRLRWDNELIEGWAADVRPDVFDRTAMLYWVRKDTPDTYLYEMIQISDCGQYRSRVWQWFNRGRLIARTLINERKITDDWSAYAV